MGSFYTTCSLSDTTIIDGQKTSIQLLINRNNRHVKDMEVVINEDGAMLNFMPFGFPIHGYYDDYGRIAGYETDKNIEMIEKYFNLDIETIIKIASGRCEDIPDEAKNEEFLNKLEITFFRTEVLESMCSSWDKLDETVKGSWGNRFPDMWNYMYQQYEIAYKDRFALALTGVKIELLPEYSYFPRYTPENMYQRMNINLDDFKIELKKHVQLFDNMRELHLLLRPSWYGNQQDNYFSKYTFYKNMFSRVTEDIKKQFNNDWYEDEDNEIINEIFFQEKQQIRLNKLKEITKYSDLDEEKEYLEKRLIEINNELKNNEND